jgi:hypothetical protein
MTNALLPTQAEIKEILHYDPETGIFRWRFARPKGKVKPWDVAGSLRHGYIVVKINQRRYCAHRLAWIYMTGKWPENDVDHEDRVRSNNSWKNLRAATRKQNCENRAFSERNKSGFRGVCWDKKNRKWLAYVRHNNKNIHLGYFDNVEEAGKVANDKRAELFTHYTGNNKAYPLLK